MVYGCSIERAINVEFKNSLILVLLIVHARTAIYKHLKLDLVFSITFLECKDELISKQPFLFPVQIHLFFFFIYKSPLVWCTWKSGVHMSLARNTKGQVHFLNSTASTTSWFYRK